MSLGLLGGVDPTGGAGLLRDFWTAQSLAPSLPVRCVATALTEQGRRRDAARARATGRTVLEDQLRSLSAVRVAKIGLVPSSTSDVVARWSATFGGVTVLDPVRAASEGGDLGTSASGYLSLICESTLLTPNLPEARWLSGSDQRGAALLRALASRSGARRILLKGGHGGDPDWVEDLWWEVGEITEIRRPRVPGGEVRGTGCALGTAIAVRLAQGATPLDAVRAGVMWLDRERTRAREMPAGARHLPVPRPPQARG